VCSSDLFRFNDAVIRNLIIQRPGPDTEPSPLARPRDEREVRGDFEESPLEEDSGSEGEEETEEPPA
jgi:small subunit ribosomal protein S6